MRKILSSHIFRISSIQLYTENFYTIYFFMDYLVVALEKYYYNTLYWVYNLYLNV